MSEKKKTILICEDDKALLEMLPLVFAPTYNTSLLSCIDSDIVDQVFSIRPDIILIDCKMPLIGGTKAVILLKKDVRTRHVPVLMFSALTSGEEEAMTAGADGYISKPFNLDALRNSVEDLLIRSNK